MRHATAENTSQDYNRILTEIGKQEALKSAKYLNKYEILPELILASSSVRTRETALYIKQNIRNNVQVEFIDKLYRAGANSILKQLQQLEDCYTAIMLVVHNSGVYEFSKEFLGQNQDLLRNIVPASIAYFTVECDSWSLLENGHGNLRWFFMP
ncbi:MAG: histidine phosphatase family protein [Rickettsiales endosymbiont of Dermacentor nuttalli]